MSFCKETGRINFAESCSNKSNLFKSALVPKADFATKTKDEIEQDNFSEKISGHSPTNHKQNANYVPFRMTKNFEHFIGPVGL